MSQQRVVKSKINNTDKLMPERRPSYGSGDTPETSSTAQGYDLVLFSINIPVTQKTISLKLSNLKYVTFLMIGVALLWPWNCFLSASAYYSERFKYYPSLVKIYSSTMMSVSTLTSTTANYYLSQRQKNANYSRRINVGMFTTILVFILMGFSCVSFLSLSSVVFFPILMFMILISSLATCLSQNGCMAIASVMGPIYANAVMVGQSIAGVLPSVALIASIIATGPRDDSPQEEEHVEQNYGLFVYYIMASFIALFSVILYKWSNSYGAKADYQAISLENDESNELESSDDLQEPDSTKKHVPLSLLWSKLKHIVSSIFLTFSISLIFPVFASSVLATTESDNFFFNKQIFIPFVYLLWNIGDLLGRLFCLKSFFQIKSPNKLLVIACSRILFIPIFLCCNVNGESYIFNDWFYFLFQLLFGFSNGQLASSCFMILGNFVEDDEKEAAGGFSTIFLSCGLAAGSLFSYVLVALID